MSMTQQRVEFLKLRKAKVVYKRSLIKFAHKKSRYNKFVDTFSYSLGLNFGYFIKFDWFEQTKSVQSFLPMILIYRWGNLFI